MCVKKKSWSVAFLQSFQILKLQTFFSKLKICNDSLKTFKFAENLDQRSNNLSEF